MPENMVNKQIVPAKELCSFHVNRFKKTSNSSICSPKNWSFYLRCIRKTRKICWLSSHKTLKITSKFWKVELGFNSRSTFDTKIHCVTTCKGEQNIWIQEHGIINNNVAILNNLPSIKYYATLWNLQYYGPTRLWPDKTQKIADIFYD